VVTPGGMPPPPTGQNPRMVRGPGQHRLDGGAHISGRSSRQHVARRDVAEDRHAPARDLVNRFHPSYGCRIVEVHAEVGIMLHRLTEIGVVVEQLHRHWCVETGLSDRGEQIRDNRPR